MSKLAGPLAAFVLFAVAAPAHAERSEHELDGHWMYWSFMAGTMQSNADADTANYHGADLNGAIGWSAILGGFVYSEMNASLGKGDGGWYFLDYLNFDAGFGIPIPLDDSDDRDFLFIGASPLALYLVTVAPQIGISTHAKLQIDDVLLEAKAVPVSYLEGADVSGANLPYYVGLHYWVADWWSLGVRYDSYDHQTGNTSLALHMML